MSENDDIKYVREWIERWQIRWMILFNLLKGVIFVLVVLSWFFVPFILLLGGYGYKMSQVALMLGVLTYVIGGIVIFYYLWYYLIEPEKRIKCPKCGKEKIK